MSALTKREREGLNEVFLSIHTHQSRYKKIKQLSALITAHYKILKLHRAIKKAKLEVDSFLSHRS